MKLTLKIAFIGLICLGAAVRIVFLAGGNDLLRAFGYTPSKPVPPPHSPAERSLASISASSRM